MAQTLGKRYKLSMSNGESHIVELTEIDLRNLEKSRKFVNKEYSHTMWLFSPPIKEIVFIDLYSIVDIKETGNDYISK